MASQRRLERVAVLGWRVFVAQREVVEKIRQSAFPVDEGAIAVERGDVRGRAHRAATVARAAASMRSSAMRKFSSELA